jgi:hypothetical protein
MVGHSFGSLDTQNAQCSIENYINVMHSAVVIGLDKTV